MTADACWTQTAVCSRSPPGLTPRSATSVGLRRSCATQATARPTGRARGAGGPTQKQLVNSPWASLSSESSVSESSASFCRVGLAGVGSGGWRARTRVLRPFPPASTACGGGETHDGGRGQGCIGRGGGGGLKAGEGGFGWDPPPPRVPPWSPPLKSSWNQRRRSKIVSLKHWKGGGGGRGSKSRVPPPPPTVYGRSNTSLAGGRERLTSQTGNATPDHGSVATVTSRGQAGGQRPKKSLVYRKSTSNFGPL